MTMITNNATNNNTNTNKEDITMRELIERAEQMLAATTITKTSDTNYVDKKMLAKMITDLGNGSPNPDKNTRPVLISWLRDTVDALYDGIAQFAKDSGITVPVGDMTNDKYYPENNTKHYSTEVNTDDEAYWKSLTHRNISNKDLQWQAIMASASNNVVTEENMVATIMKKLLRKGVIYEATKLHAPLDRLNNKKFGTVKLKVLRAIVFKVYNNCHTEKATEVEVDAVLDYMVQNHIIARDYFDSATGKVPQYLIPNATWDKYGVKNFIKA